MKKAGKIVITMMGPFFKMENGDLYEILNPEMVADSDSAMRQAKSQKKSPLKKSTRTEWQNRHRRELKI